MYTIPEATSCFNSVCVAPSVVAMALVALLLTAAFAIVRPMTKN